MRNLLLVILIPILLGIFEANAQNNDGNNYNSYYVNHYENEIPPTPSAANFLQYGNTPVNISRGLPNISIPIYTLEVDGIQIPISISYDASGVKVDDISSTVGMKWTLNAGGGVFRTVKDRDDFASSFSWIRGDTNQPRFEEWWNNIQPDAQWFMDTDNQFAIETHISSWDQWPDNFRYNFMGYSGEFKFSPDGTIVKGVNDAVTLKPRNVNATNLLYSYFTANDQSGNNFIFSSNINNKDVNHTKYWTTMDYDPYLTGSMDSGSHIVGWLLDYIETKNGKEIEIEYENTQNGPPDIYLFPYEINPISEQLLRVGGCGPCYIGAELPWDCVSEEDSRGYSYYYRSGTKMQYNPSSSLIKEIRSENVDIEFAYLENDISENGSTTIINGWKKRVSTIIITDKIGGKSKKFHFKYGVFSGDARLKLIEIQEEGFGGEFKPPYKFTYDEDEDLPPLGSKSKDYMGYYNGKNNSSLIPKTAATLNILSQNQVRNSVRNYVILGDRYFDSDFLSTGVLTNIEYPTGGKTEFTYEVNAMGVNTEEPLIKLRENVISNSDFENDDPNIVNLYSQHHEYVYSQLVEIKNVAGQFDFTNLGDCPDCDCVCPITPAIKIYKYNGSLNDDPSDYFNTGKIGEGPVLVSPIGTSNNPFSVASFDSSNGNGVYIVMLFLGGQSSVYDPNEFNVRVAYKWNEKESDSNGNVVFQENYFGGLRIKEIKDFDEDNVVYNHKKYNYNQFYQDEGFGFKDGNYTKSYGGPFFIFSEIVETVPQFPLVSGYCYTNVDTEIIGSGNPQVINEKFRENRVFNSISDGLPLKKSIFDNTGQLLEFNEFLYRNESTTPVLDFYTPSEKINPLDYTACNIQSIKTLSSYNENRIRNKFFSVDNLISIKKSTQLFQYGSTYKPVTTIESYEYNNNRLMKREIKDTRYTAVMAGDQVTGYNLDNPAGEIMQVDYKYVDDPSINPPLTSLPDGLSISKEVFDLKDPNNSSDDLKVLGQYFEYDNVGNIKNSYRYNKGGGTNSGPSYVPADYELDVAYLTDQGKPTQILGQDGVVTSYIWGYNKQYPVAKIVGLSYASAIATPGFNLAGINASSDAQAIQDEIKKIRLAYPNAQITTYTYNPMIGVSLIIDPKGLKNTYHYDGFGRLMYVKDQDGNILSKNEYHYKN